MQTQLQRSKHDPTETRCKLTLLILFLLGAALILGGLWGIRQYQQSGFDQEATQEEFTQDGWLRTGDLGSMDSNGNIFIRGRLKTMILSSSGQNIFPEELETKLNNLPFILESLVIERNKKLVALVYADYEALDSLGLNNPNNLKTIMDENLKNLNSNVAAYEKISRIQLYPTEFEKTPKRSIKRYLYNSIAVD